MLSILFTVVVIVAGALWIQSKKKDPEKILNIYSQPGKWYHLKYLIFLAILAVRRLRSNAKVSVTSENGNSSITFEDELDKVKQLSEHEKVIHT